jgi:hypothetical protein
VRSLNLRYLILDVLSHSGQSMTVAEMVGAIEAHGFVIGSRASKTVSDAMRTDISQGRAVRAGWGRYRFGAMPPSTRRYVDRAAANLRELEKSRNNVAPPMIAASRRIGDPVRPALPVPERAHPTDGLFGRGTELA